MNPFTARTEIGIARAIHSASCRRDKPLMSMRENGIQVINTSARHGRMVCKALRPKLGQIERDAHACPFPGRGARAPLLHFVVDLRAVRRL